jgi:biotin synthase
MKTSAQTIQFASSYPVKQHPHSDRIALETVKALFDLPFMELLFQAQQTHRAHFNPQYIQLSALLSIKTGGCPEDCSYCPQSVHHETTVDNQPLMNMEDVMIAARQAKAEGASRFCLAAAWRSPKAKDVDKVTAMIRAIKALGLETCATLGMLKDEQAVALKAAGLDYYNHNVDTASHRYEEIISTRTYQDRLETLGYVREAGLSVCCGGIIGMGESRDDRAVFITELANLDPQPESVPINHLVRVEGTALAEQEPLDWTEFVRTIAVARIALPQSYVRLSAGRQDMHESVQALCFLAGANAIFYGDKLLTTANPEVEQDKKLLAKLNLIPQ